MKIYITANGYFYKENVNGKKRISKREYNILKNSRNLKSNEVNEINEINEVNEINEMECGRFIYNGQKISKVKRFLSIK